MQFLRRLKIFCLPTQENAYRPAILERRSLLLFLGAILVAEGLLVANLFGRSAMPDFLAAVVSSEIISLTNVERAQAETISLRENPLLAAAAQRKAEDMAARGYFSHTGPDGKPPWSWIAEAGYDYHFAGENLAVHFVDSSDVVEAWMDSPSHRANIVKPLYQEIGVGVAHGSYQGSPAIFVVQFFGTPQNTQLSAAVGQSPSSFFESLSRGFARVLAEPRGTTTMVLGSVAAVLLLALALTFFVHVQVQPSDLLLKGSMVALFALCLLTVNGKALNNGDANQAAVAGAPAGLRVQESGVVLSESGVSTERFVVEY